MRNGNKVSIKKVLIDKIIWMSDTIKYNGYVCSDKPVPVIHFNETPEYKLMVLLDKAPESGQSFNEKSKVAFLFSPLQGNYNADEFIGVQLPIVQLFMKKVPTMGISPDEMWSEMSSAQHRFDYAFIARQYHVAIGNAKSGGFGNLGFNNTQGASGFEKKKEVFTSAIFILYDLNRKEIVFRKDLGENRSVFGVSDYTWTGLLTPEEWKKQWGNDRTNRKLNQNAESIRNTLVKEISRYLGL